MRDKSRGGSWRALPTKSIDVASYNFFGPFQVNSQWRNEMSFRAWRHEFIGRSRKAIAPPRETIRARMKASIETWSNRVLDLLAPCFYSHRVDFRDHDQLSAVKRDHYISVRRKQRPPPRKSVSSHRELGGWSAEPLEPLPDESSVRTLIWRCLARCPSIL
jgi:hypothetical protein